MHLKRLLLFTVSILVMQSAYATYTLTDWQIISYMNEYRFDFQAVIIQGYMYAIGGENANDSVERAQLLTNGNLGPWQYVNELPVTSFVQFGAVTANNSIYLIGGGEYWSDIILNTVERATVNADSTLSTWSILSSTLLDPSGDFVTVVANNRIYVIGGADATSVLNTVEYADLNTDGTLGPFVWSTTHLTMPEGGLSGIYFQNHIYVTGGKVVEGGAGPKPTEVAQVYPDGELGAWQDINTTMTQHDETDAVTDGQYLYIVGGFASSGVGESGPVESAQLYSIGSVGSWQYEPSLNIGRGGMSAVINYPYIYAVDGYNDGYGDMNSIERAMILPLSVEKKYWEILE